MADGQEETVDGQVVALLIGLTLTPHKMSALHTILAIKAQCVGFVENLDLGVLLHAFAHDVGGAQERFAHNHIDLLA